MPSASAPRIPTKITARYDNWAINIFCFSTLFILIFSIKAIQSWPPLIGKLSILLACIMPATMIAFIQIPAYFRKKKVPKEILWAFLICILCLTSSMLSQTPLISLKATGLFIASGPLIFITTMYLFKSARNQTVFLWVSSLYLLCLGLLGIYEFNNSEGISLFSRNPLPAGASLAILSAGPMILLAQKHSAVSRTILVSSLILTVTIIVLLTKKGPALNLIVILLFWAVFINLRYLKVLLGLFLLTGCLLYFSESALSKHKNLIEINTSVTLRAELIFFGFHIFKENPIWGIGSKTKLNSYLENYKTKFPDYIWEPGSRIEYLMSENTLNIVRSYNMVRENYIQQHFRKFNTFENIFLAFLVEMGGVFTITYFGGLLYIIGRCLKNSPSPSKDIEVMSLVSVMVGFLVISCTFDTLRFPNLNWLFHSLLGLLVNLAQRSLGNHHEPS